MNRAINSKKIIALVAIVALVAILGVCLVACNADSVSKSLEKKGYTAGKLTEDSKGFGAIVYGIVSTNDSFKEGVFAVKDTDSVAVIWFNDADEAKKMEESLSKSTALKVFSVKVDRSSKVLYVGTEQGVKDAK